MVRVVDDTLPTLVLYSYLCIHSSQSSSGEDAHQQFLSAHVLSHG